MEQLNTFPIYALGKWLDSVFLHAALPLKLNIVSWHRARQVLDFLIAQGPGRGEFGLKESAGIGMQLSMKLLAALNRFTADGEASLPSEEATELQQLILRFESGLELDLSRAPTYFVTQKGIYSTDYLIRLADWAIPKELRWKQVIPELALKDLNQSGGCLAFGMATASGYHAVRSVERVLRAYYVAATGLSDVPRVDKTKPSRPIEKCNMAAIIYALRASGAGDAKTLAVLDQIRDLHRNPLGHPDVFLEPMEALELFNVCSSAISAMGRQLLKLIEQTPTPKM